MSDTLGKQCLGWTRHIRSLLAVMNPPAGVYDDTDHQRDIKRQEENYDPDKRARRRGQRRSRQRF